MPTQNFRPSRDLGPQTPSWGWQNHGAQSRPLQPFLLKVAEAL